MAEANEDLAHQKKLAAKLQKRCKKQDKAIRRLDADKSFLLDNLRNVKREGELGNSLA